MALDNLHVVPLKGSREAVCHHLDHGLHCYHLQRSQQDAQILQLRPPLPLLPAGAQEAGRLLAHRTCANGLLHLLELKPSHMCIGCAL